MFVNTSYYYWIIIIQYKIKALQCFKKSITMILWTHKGYFVYCSILLTVRHMHLYAFHCVLKLSTHLICVRKVCILTLYKQNNYTELTRACFDIIIQTVVVVVMNIHVL